MAEDRPSPAERARHLIATATNLTLASVDAEGSPWVSPVFYAPDPEYRLYWTSAPEARHSANIRATGTVALVIVEPDPDARVDALYIDASARELSAPAEIAAAIPVLLAKPQPERWTITDAADVAPGGPWRIYRAEPTSFSVRHTETVAGKAVAGRIPADPRSAAHHELAERAPAAIAHLNADHADALRLIAQRLGGHPEAEWAEVLALDPTGLTLLVHSADASAQTRVAFPAPLAAAAELRGACVALTDQARRAPIGRTRRSTA